MPHLNLKRIRFRFSLGFLLWFTFVIGGGLGLWFGFVEPIKREWRIVEPILARGGKVETIGSQIPGFLTFLFSEGQSSHVEAVFANKKKVGVKELRAFKHLPKLKRLYLERAGLTDEHLAAIGELKSLERLSIWGNEDITDVGLASVKSIATLQFVDISNNFDLSWRSSLILKRPGLGIRQRKKYWECELLAGELDDLLLTGIEPSYLTLNDLGENELTQALNRLSPRSVYLNVRSSEFSNRVVELIQGSTSITEARVHFLDQFNYSTFRYSVENCSDRLTAFLCGEVPFIGGPQFPLNHGVALVHHRHESKQVLRFYGEPSDFRIHELPVLENVEYVSIVSDECRPDTFSIDHWIDVVKVCPNVTELVLWESESGQAEKLNLVCELENLVKLKLNLSNTFEMPNDWFENLQSKASLEELRISGTTLGVEQLGPICDYPKLRHANLFCPQLPLGIRRSYTAYGSIVQLRAARAEANAKAKAQPD